jgi:hypothetical protein
MIIHPIHLAIAKNKRKKLVLDLYTVCSLTISVLILKPAIEVVLPSEADSLLIDGSQTVYSETETVRFIEDYHLLIENILQIIQ